MEPAAHAGHAKSQWRVSRWLKSAGESVAARICLESAAAGGGLALAQFSLARHFLKRGDPTAQQRACNLFRQAAASGQARAAYCVGVCHHQAIGTRRDPRAACQWFERAAALGSSAAKVAMEKLDRASRVDDARRRVRLTRRPAS